MVQPRRGASSQPAPADRKADSSPQSLAPGLAVRLAAADVYRDILSARQSLEDRLGAETISGRFRAFDARDLGLMRSIVVTSLRRRGSILHALAQCLERGMPGRDMRVESILVTAAAQILYLDVPDRSAVDLAVRAARMEPGARPFAALVNAVLRNVARNSASFQGDDDPLRDTPAWLADRWSATFGGPAAAAIAASHRHEPTLDLTVRGEPEAWAARLGGRVLPTGSVRLVARTPVTRLDGYDEGEWWVQDCAAALPARILAARPGERIADLCAAPGGKTAQLATAGAQVSAVDRSERRLQRLRANLQRLRLDAEVVTADALTFAPADLFDAVLVDAPCTATGTIRRHPEVAWIKREQDIRALAELQRRLLDHAATLLRPGGRLVYCTCSLEPEEGERQVDALLARNCALTRAPIDPEEIAGMAECVSAVGDVRVMPYFLRDDDPRLSGMDGFFIARLLRAPH